MERCLKIHKLQYLCHLLLYIKYLITYVFQKWKFSTKGNCGDSKAIFWSYYSWIQRFLSFWLLSIPFLNNIKGDRTICKCFRNSTTILDELGSETEKLIFTTYKLREVRIWQHNTSVLSLRFPKFPSFVLGIRQLFQI